MNIIIYIYMRKYQSNYNFGDYYCNVIDMIFDFLKVYIVMKIFVFQKIYIWENIYKYKYSYVFRIIYYRFEV